jgi:hypothetical protein
VGRDLAEAGTGLQIPDQRLATIGVLLEVGGVSRQCAAQFARQAAREHMLEQLIADAALRIIENGRPGGRRMRLGHEFSPDALARRSRQMTLQSGGDQAGILVRIRRFVS